MITTKEQNLATAAKDAVKVCTKCKTEKPLAEFSKRKKSALGINHACRGCCKDYADDYRNRNRARLRQESRERRRIKGVESRPVGSTRAYYAPDELWECKSCGEFKPATQDNFSLRYKSCRKCRSRANTERTKRLRVSDPDRFLEYQRAWRARHPERARELYHRWVERNPERARAVQATGSHKRRSRTVAAEGNFTKEDVLLLIDTQTGTCFYCEEKLGLDFHVDHYVPLVRGGCNSAGNIVLACPRCNLRKGARMPWEFHSALSSAVST
jgi:5-methylcytosine-specific restriction endonuclease McrA